MIGIDVSDNQGYIDWARVKQAGVEFAILRTTRRSAKPDTFLASNINGCIKNNIPVDFYKYSYALSEAEAINEADRVCAVLNRYGIKPNKDTVIWMDVEDPTQLALPKDKVTEIAKAFRRAILNNGYTFGLYMGKYCYDTEKLDPMQFAGPLWIARYYNGYNVMDISDKPNEKYKPEAKTGPLWGWQYTSSGRVDGIKGTVDLDISYYDITPVEPDPEYYATPEFTLIESLNKIGVDSSFSNREKIAKANGIENYTGTYSQNTEMLNLLNKGELIQA